MRPEYIEELANLADPDQLWRLPGLKQMELPPEKKRQLDAGVALRRHASHERDLLRLLEQGRSLLITPLSPNSTAVMYCDTPEKHERLRRTTPWKPSNA